MEPSGCTAATTAATPGRLPERATRLTVMARIEVRLPGLLAQIVGGSKWLEVEADTVRGAVDRLLIEYPVLKVHLFDESGELRPHVNLFHNETNTRSSMDVPVQSGDDLTVIQAVSGG